MTPEIIAALNIAKEIKIKINNYIKSKRYDEAIDELVKIIEKKDNESKNLKNQIKKLKTLTNEKFEYFAIETESDNKTKNYYLKLFHKLNIRTKPTLIPLRRNINIPGMITEYKIKWFINVKDSECWENWNENNNNNK